MGAMLLCRSVTAGAQGWRGMQGAWRNPHSQTVWCYEAYCWLLWLKSISAKCYNKCNTRVLQVAAITCVQPRRAAGRQELAVRRLHDRRGEGGRSSQSHTACCCRAHLIAGCRRCCSIPLRGVVTSTRKHIGIQTATHKHRRIQAATTTRKHRCRRLLVTRRSAPRCSWETAATAVAAARRPAVVLGRARAA